MRHRRRTVMGRLHLRQVGALQVRRRLLRGAVWRGYNLQSDFLPDTVIC